MYILDCVSGVFWPRSGVTSLAQIDSDTSLELGWPTSPSGGGSASAATSRRSLGSISAIGFTEQVCALTGTITGENLIQADESLK